MGKKMTRRCEMKTNVKIYEGMTFVGWADEVDTQEEIAYQNGEPIASGRYDEEENIFYVEQR